MTLKKTIPVPVAADGVPIIVDDLRPERTRELPALELPDEDKTPEATATQAAPREVVDDEITVPILSSIESSVTFEILRRQSTETDEEDGK